MWEGRLRDFLARYIKAVEECETVSSYGSVTKVVGLLTEGTGIKAAVGDVCEIESDGSRIKAEVIGFRDGRLLLMPFGDSLGITPDSKIFYLGKHAEIGVGMDMLGRVVDALGNPMDGGGPIPVEERYPLYAHPGNPMERERISQSLDAGIRVINGLLTLGKGQRVGIFAGSGVGKTTLLGMMTRFSKADVNVVALVGERGKEVKDFIKRDVGSAMGRTVVVVATSDQPSLLRVRAAFSATSIAEFFRDQGMDVLLIMDSVTRLAMAQRELGLSSGEPPTTKGYPPSVFAMLPKLLERPGNWKRGSITAIYTVLVEGDDMTDPIADTVRSILDGHIVLSRELARRNIYPPVDVLGSVSRVMPDIVTKEHWELAGKFRDVLATYREAEDLINIGAYKEGTNPKIDRALRLINGLESYIKQGIDEGVSFEESIRMLKEVLGEEV